MRIKKKIILGIISWSNTKFSELHYKNCMVDCKENYKLNLGVKGLTNNPYEKYILQSFLPGTY